MQPVGGMESQLEEGAFRDGQEFVPSGVVRIGKMQLIDKHACIKPRRPVASGVSGSSPCAASASQPVFCYLDLSA